MMSLTTLALALLTATVSADLISSGIGDLPTCGTTCTVLTGASSTCGTSWSCFCKTVWTNSGENIAALCANNCPNPTDLAGVSAWYTANCGDDNGAAEHPPGSTPSASSTTKSAAPTSSGSAASGGDSSSSNSSSSSSSKCSGSWIHCHYQYVIAIVIIAIGLIVLGFGGRWLKKRHDRKRDQNREGFNSGITSRTAGVHDDKAGSSSDASAPFEGAGSTARTRENFMPYGYGYAHGGGDGRNSPPITRGGTPFEEMEKTEYAYPSMPESGLKNKMRRVLVREKSLR